MVVVEFWYPLSTFGVHSMRKKLQFLRYYNQFHDKIFTYLLYRVQFDRPLAEDLTSEVFLKAYDKFDSFDKDRSFQAWIYRIAHNHLVNHYKGKKPQTALEDVEHVLEDDTDLPQHIDIQIDLERLKLLMAELPDAMQEIIELRYLHELSHDEIAECLQKNVGAVRTMLSRSMKKLKILAVPV